MRGTGIGDNLMGEKDLRVRAICSGELSFDFRGDSILMGRDTTNIVVIVVSSRIFGGRET